MTDQAGSYELVSATASDGTRAESFNLPARYLACKRGLDIVVSILALGLLAPVLVLIAVVVRCSSSGPVLFKQERAGRFGRNFLIYKFRTMSTDAPPNAYKVPAGHHHITGPGRFLRSSGLDELPQLWNVLVGEMSLVGPRPEVFQIASDHGLLSHPRCLIRPGITGWWQIHHRTDIPLHLNLQYDIDYLRLLSPKVDAVIVWKTCALVIRSFTRTRAGRP
jgi:lipopolysaccharide/colanic/teichoic acid biosynthesis glycosyltransferase